MPEYPNPLPNYGDLPPSTFNEDADGRKSDGDEAGGYWHPTENPDLHVKEFYCVRHDCVMEISDMASVAVCDEAWQSGKPFQELGCVWQYHNERGVMTISEEMTAYIVRSKNAQEPV